VNRSGAGFRSGEFFVAPLPPRRTVFKLRLPYVFRAVAGAWGTLRMGVATPCRSVEIPAAGPFPEFFFASLPWQEFPDVR